MKRDDNNDSRSGDPMAIAIVACLLSSENLTRHGDATLTPKDFLADAATLIAAAKRVRSR